MKKIMIDFVIDATESASINLPAINLFCDDLIVKGYHKIIWKNLYYGITVFYGKEHPAKIYRFGEKDFTDNRYEFNRVFDTIQSGNGSSDGKDNIMGGIRRSSRKFRRIEKDDPKIMIVFSDSYVEKGRLGDIGIIPAQKLHLFLAGREELGDVNMNMFWGMPMLNANQKVDHRLTPQFHYLSDIFDLKKREWKLDEMITEISDM